MATKRPAKRKNTTKAAKARARRQPRAASGRFKKK